MNGGEKRKKNLNNESGLASFGLDPDVQGGSSSEGSSLKKKKKIYSNLAAAPPLEAR